VSDRAKSIKAVVAAATRQPGNPFKTGAASVHQSRAISDVCTILKRGRVSRVVVLQLQSLSGVQNHTTCSGRACNRSARLSRKISIVQTYRIFPRKVLQLYLFCLVCSLIGQTRKGKEAIHRARWAIRVEEKVPVAWPGDCVLRHQGQNGGDGEGVGRRLVHRAVESIEENKTVRQWTSGEMNALGLGIDAPTMRAVVHIP
jgi:hypothetical protein